MVKYYGRKVSSDVDAGVTGNGNSNQRYSVFAEMPENGWGYIMYLLAGRSTASSAAARLAVGNVDGSGNPSRRIAYTSQFTISALATGGNDATEYSANISVVASAYGTLQTAVMLAAGIRYGLGFAAINAPIYHGMIQAANPANNYPNQYLYYKDVASAIPADPIAYSSSSYEGVMSISIGYDPNQAPNTPVGLTNGNQSSLTPTLVSSFSDANENRGDMIKQYRMKLRILGQTTNKWTSAAITASNAEQTADATSFVYNGSALSVGVSYEWAIQHSDQFGEWSAWSAWTTITINSGGAVAAPTSPSGKQLTITPTPYNGVWTHGGGLNAKTMRVTVRQGGAVVWGPITYTMGAQVAPGGTLSATYAQLVTANGGPLAPLGWGGSYTVEIAGQDTANLWSNPSPVTAFTTDAYPNTPSSLYPNGQVFSSLPTLSATITDPDNDYTNGLVTSSRLFGPYINTNEDFEAALITPWTSPGTAGFTKALTRDTAIKHGGVASGKLAITANSNGIGANTNIDNDNLLSCVPGMTYTYGLWLYTTNVNLHPRLQIHFHDSGGTWLGPSTEADYVPAAPNVWYFRTFTTTAPVNAVQMKMSCMVYAATASAIGTVYLDDAHFNDGYHTFRANTYNVANQKWERAIDALDDIVYGTYTYDMVATDGTLTSAYSTQATFTYGQGPSVTVTAPVGTITTNTPLVTWGATGQVKYQVFVYYAGTTTLVHDSGLVTSALQNYQIPAGVLHNLISYDVYVAITNITPLTGTSLASTFLVSYPALPISSNFIVTPYQIQGDPKATALLATWDSPPEPPSTFIQWILKRRYQGTAAGDASEITLRTMTSISQLAFVDYLPASNRAYTYSLVRSVIQGTDQTDSPEATYDAMVSFDHIVICSATDGGNYRIPLRFVKTRAKFKHVDDVAFHKSWGDKQPIAMIGNTDYDTFTATYQVISDRYAIGFDLMDDLAALKTRELSGDVMVFRDNKRRKVLGYFSYGEEDGELTDYLVDIAFTETNAKEGEE